MTSIAHTRRVLKSQLGQGHQILSDSWNREQIGDRHVWCGRRLWIVDGSSCSMPDTPSLQQRFGQPSGQKKGCGFPVAKIVAMFCWATGAVPDVAIGPWRASELHVWRRLWTLFQPGDVVLGDRYYCSFGGLAQLQRRGVDGVFRLHQRRSADFRRGRRLDKNDRLVTWRRPTFSCRPRGMTMRQWRLLPDELTVRLLRVFVNQPGFRSRVIDIATTLLDPVAYPAECLAALYRDRWTVELRLRDLKTTLGMDVLRWHSPDIVQKEMYLHLLAYNLIRTLMWRAAPCTGSASPERWIGSTPCCRICGCFSRPPGRNDWFSCCCYGSRTICCRIALTASNPAPKNDDRKNTPYSINPVPKCEKPLLDEYLCVIFMPFGSDPFNFCRQVSWTSYRRNRMMIVQKVLQRRLLGAGNHTILDGRGGNGSGVCFL